MNSNTFQFKRVGMLIGRAFQLNSKTMLNTALVLAALPIVFLLLHRLTTDNATSLLLRGRILTIIVGMFLGLSPFFFYNAYNHPKKGLPEVMLPASVLEKFVAMQVTCMTVLPLMALLFFGGSDALLTTLFPGYQNGYAIADFFNDKLTADGVLILFLTFQAVFFCNLLFVNRKVIKTIASFVVVNLLFSIVLVIAISAMESLGYFDAISGNVHVDLNDYGLFELFREDNPLVISGLLFKLFMVVVLPIIFMIGSYRVMKTKRY
jgi:hypothetical protein